MTPVKQVPDSHTVLSEMLARDGELIPVHGLSRREVVVLLSSVAMGLAGCSSGTPTGSGPPPPPAGLGQVNGTVSLPSGSGLALNSLSLKVMGQTLALSSATTFAAGVSPTAPTMALVTDANGNGIMAGFLDSTLAGAQTISPRSTGVVLTWFALGGPFLPANVKSQVLALLTADPTMDTLGGVIAARIAAVPLAIVNADAQVATALNTAIATLTAAPAGSIGGAAHLANGTPPTITVLSVPNPKNGTIPPPSTQTTQGGVNVQSDNTIAGIDISNSYRRPVRAYVYETQTKTANVVTDITPATLFAGPFDLGEPATLAPTSGIHPFLSQPAPFHSFTISPIALVLDGASDQTTYEVVVIGPSSSGVIPAFFGAARYANEVAGWTAAIDNLFAQSFYTDLVHALLLETTGFASILPTSPNLVAAGVTTKRLLGNPILNTNAIGLPATPLTPQLLAIGIADIITDLKTNLSLAKQYLGVAPTIADPTVAAVIAKVNSIDWQASLQSGGNFLMKLASPVSNLPNYQANGALGKLLANLANADPGLLWQVEAGKAPVTITPPNPAVAPGGMVALTVVLLSDLTGIYEFDWSSSSTYATFSAADQPNALAAITTRELTVNLNTSPSDVSPIVVTLAVYEVVGGTRSILTRVTTTVTLLQKATLSPASAILAVGDQQTFTLTVAGTLPAGVKYVWSVVGGSGSIGATSPVTTTVPQITYTAQQKGTDTLSVQVLDANNKLLSNTSAVIGVAPDSYIDLTVTGTWDPTLQPSDGRYTYVDGNGLREVAPGQPSLDAMEFAYDVGSGNSGRVPGVSIFLFLSPGAPVSQGEVFTNYQGTGLFSAGQFVLDLATNQILPSDPNGGIYAAHGTGTFTITSLASLADGTNVMHYTLNITNASGGVISATGSGHWT